MGPEVICLALAIYFEARGEPNVGQVAVSQVIMNRVADHRYPDDVCGVVKQGPTYTFNDHPIKHKCQFSFWCDGKAEEIKDGEAWEWSQTLADASLKGQLIDITDGATHYHSIDVLPEWAETKCQTVRINNHIFYRWLLSDEEMVCLNSRD